METKGHLNGNYMESKWKLNGMLMETKWKRNGSQMETNSSETKQKLIQWKLNVVASVHFGMLIKWKLNGNWKLPAI